MARSRNPAGHTAKRNDIIDSALRLVYSKGYERMTIQDILDDLKMSKGAFYHYFDSKQAVLEALTERGQAEVHDHLTALTADPHLSALDKFRRYFTLLDQSRQAHQRMVLRYLRIWYTDDNAIVRQKIDAATVAHRTPLVDTIIRQGMAEGVFQVAYPEHAAAIVLALIQSMSHTHAGLMLALADTRDAGQCVRDTVTSYAAYMDAIERVLGAPPAALTRIDAQAVQVWVNALLNDEPQGEGIRL